MKEQKKREKKYNNGFFRWLIIDYLRVFISFLIKKLVGWGYYLRRKFKWKTKDGAYAPITAEDVLEK